MHPVRQSRILSQSWKVQIPFFLLFMSLPTCSSHDINLFPDVSAVAHLVYVPFNSNSAPDAVQIEEEIPALDSEKQRLRAFHACT